MIDRSSLTRALRDRRVNDWVVLERKKEVVTVEDGWTRREERTSFTVIVYADTARGRGSARLELASPEGDAREMIDRALVFASVTVGAPWRATPAAAPAQVELLDPALRDAPLVPLAEKVFGALPAAAAGIRVEAQLSVERERVTAHAANGLRTTWSASTVRGGAIVANASTSLDVVREARRLEDLGLGDAITEAAGDLSQIANAVAPRTGPCSLILGSEALVHGGTLGVWTVFATQADSERERQGLARYRLKAPIVPEANAIAEPLDVRSDGALAFATRSAPLGDDGDAVRSFAIVEKGVAVGLGMSMAEAALRKQEPNGGVRNLVVSSGTWTEAPPANRSLEVRRLRSLAIDLNTGDAALDIALAVDRENGREQLISGGQIRLDLVRALAFAKRSATPLRRGAYLGPRAVLIDDALLQL